LARPRTENGFTQVADELLEAYAGSGVFNRRARVMLALIRLTYGWHKKQDFISERQVAKLTGIQRTHVRQTLEQLESEGLIERTVRARAIGVIRLQKDYEQWSQAATPRGVQIPPTSGTPQGVAVPAPSPDPSATPGGCRSATPRGAHPKRTESKRKNAPRGRSLADQLSDFPADHHFWGEVATVIAGACTPSQARAWCRRKLPEMMARGHSSLQIVTLSWATRARPEEVESACRWAETESDPDAEAADRAAIAQYEQNYEPPRIKE
jgi:phage replication O-like protein O